MTRVEWIRQQRWCWVCGAAVKLECHEIARGPARKWAVHDPSAWFATCHDCHMGPLDSMPVVDQLAIKRRYDPNKYDRVSVNRLRGRHPDAITDADVDSAESGLIDRGILSSPWE